MYLCILVTRGPTDMRATYDTTCDVITGPSSPSPGVVIFSCPCRLVFEKKELILTDPLADRIAYITMDGGIPVGPNSIGGPAVYTVDYGYANIVSIPSGNLPVYQVLFTEVVLHIPSPLYYRAHVRVIPSLSLLAQETLDYLLQEDTSWLLVT